MIPLLFGLNSCSVNNDMIEAFFELSMPEKWWTITHPFQAPYAWELTNKTREVTNELKGHPPFGHSTEAGQLNAFKHAYWMALLSSSIGKEAAIKLGKAHEKGDLKAKGLKPDNTSDPDFQMDTWNNEVGINIGTSFAGNKREVLKEKVLDALCAGKLKYLTKMDKGTTKADSTCFVKHAGDSALYLLPTHCP